MKCDGRIHDRKKLAGLFWGLQSRARPHSWNRLGTASSVASWLDGAGQCAYEEYLQCFRRLSDVLRAEDGEQLDVSLRDRDVSDSSTMKSVVKHD